MGCLSPGRKVLSDAGLFLLLQLSCKQPVENLNLVGALLKPA